MKTTTEMQLVPIAKLVPYVNNARTHSPEQIKKLRSSLREFGFINPVIIDREYGVIAGHGRILAAKEEGIREVPCVFADHLTEAQKKAYIIADNRMAMDAGYRQSVWLVRKRHQNRCRRQEWRPIAEYLQNLKSRSPAMKCRWSIILPISRAIRNGNWWRFMQMTGFLPPTRQSEKLLIV